MGYKPTRVLRPGKYMHCTATITLLEGKLCPIVCVALQRKYLDGIVYSYRSRADTLYSPPLPIGDRYRPIALYGRDTALIHVTQTSRTNQSKANTRYTK